MFTICLIIFPPNPVSFPDLPRVWANLYKYYFSKPRSCKESVAMSLGLLWSLTVVCSIALLSGWELYDLIFNWAWSRKDRKISYSLTGDFYSRQLCSKPPRCFGSVYPHASFLFLVNSTSTIYFYSVLPIPFPYLHPGCTFVTFKSYYCSVFLVSTPGPSLSYLAFPQIHE